MKWLLGRFLFFPTLVWNALLHQLIPNRRWWDSIDDHVVLGALPFRSHVAQLQSIGVTAVVNLCEEWKGPIGAYEQAGIEQLRLPTVDYCSPNLADVQRGIEFIDAQAASGGGVYVHCKAGRGRSATLVLCWLIASKRLSVDAADQLLFERRPHISKHLKQRSVVKQICQLPG